MTREPTVQVWTRIPIAAAAKLYELAGTKNQTVSEYLRDMLVGESTKASTPSKAPKRTKAVRK